MLVILLVSYRTLPKDRNDKFAALVATGKLTESIAQDDDKRWLFYLDSESKIVSMITYDNYSCVMV